MRASFVMLLILLLVSTDSLAQDFRASGPEGINSLSTGLDGSGVVIGMVEPGRPGKWQYDLNSNAASSVSPTQVYVGGTVDPPNSSEIRNHSTSVAGIMIAGDDQGGFSGYGGISPGAELHASSIGPGSLTDYQTAMDAMARVQNESTRAINLSFGVPISALGAFRADGNNGMTQLVDWSASEHDVLYVAAWPNDSNNAPSAPSDNFNGITVASSIPDDINDLMSHTTSSTAATTQSTWPMPLVLEPAST